MSTAAEADRALRIANSPLKVLVENRLRDGALLDIAVRLLAGAEVRELWGNPPVPPAITVLHAGGTGDMPAFIAHETEIAQESGIPLRLIVIVDRDQDSPGKPPSSSAERVRQEALRLGAKPFILTKHEAENYIPNFHWQKELERDPRNPSWTEDITNLLSMPPADRDYYDMLRFKKVPAQYDRKRPYHLEILSQTVQRVQDQSTRNTMAADLRVRDHSGDLQAILELIEQER